MNKEKFHNKTQFALDHAKKIGADQTSLSFGPLQDSQSQHKMVRLIQLKIIRIKDFLSVCI